METLSHILKNSMQDLRQQCQEKTDLLHIVQSILPSYIAEHCQIGNVDAQKGCITLMLDDACWLLRCRHLTPKVLERLNQSEKKWQRIVWRIRPQTKIG